MRIIYGSKDLKNEKCAVALGDFDAIHKGHILIISEMVSYAKVNGLTSMVYMFDKNPNKNALCVNSLEKRLEIIENMGVDVVVIEEFTQEYKNIPYAEFALEYVIERLNAKAVFVGFNYRFGKNAEGDAEKLKSLCKTKDIEVFITDCVKIGDVPVSSSQIRKFIEIGEMEKAKEFMERVFSISGIVIHGKQIGRTIGFPTANIEYPEDVAVPRSGVYITRTVVGENKYYSITNVGEKPTVYDSKENIETAIGNFHEDIYGKKIEIEFFKRIRDISKFKSLDELKARLEKDMELSKNFFNERN